MKWARSVGAVLAGYAVMTAALRVAFVWAYPGVGLFALATIVGGIAAGFLTGWLAGAYEIRHAGAIGFLILITVFLTIRGHGFTTPTWWETTVAGCGPVSGLLGAALLLLSKGKGSHV